MATGEFQPRYHPAGFDDELGLVLDDVRAGRWRSMRDLLGRSDSWALRTARSQVLAAAAAQGDTVAAWRQEDGFHQNAAMMQARVDVQRALNAYQACQRNAARLGQQARASAEYAVRCWPADPVPWVALLTLAQVDTVEIRQRRPEHRMSPWERPLPPGPWGLLYDVCRRDPLNREGWHRMLQALQAYREPTSDFVRWVSSRAPEGSPSALLPLYAYVDVYRSRRSGGLPTPLYWRSDPVPYYARSALTRWFAHADRTSWSPVDLNYLAHALSASGIAEGAEVFEAIGTRVTPAPWKYVSDVPEQWQETFLAARRHYVPDATGGPLHARPRR